MDLKINKKTLILIAIFVGIGVVIGLIVVFFMNSGNSDLPDDGIEVPLNYSETREVEISPDITISNEESRVNVYKINIESEESRIFNFIENSNISHYSYRVNETLYQWGGGDATYIDLVTYDSHSQYLSFNTENPISISGISKPIDNENEAYDLAVDIMKFIMNENLDFELVSSERESGNYVVNFSRVVDGLRIESPNMGAYSDTLTLDKDGHIVFGKVLIASFYDSARVEVVKFAQIGSLLQSESYPYTFIPDAPIGYNATIEEQDGDYAEIPPEALQNDYLGDVTSCTAQSAELVYYYQSTYQTYLVPTYHINCMGSTTIDGLKFDVPVLVYANAINPDLVYNPE